MRRILLVIVFAGYASLLQAQRSVLRNEITETLRGAAMQQAAWALTQQPVTVTAEHCPRSVGTRNDFCSEGDYWWPDTLNPEGPYVQRDGMSNPENFTAHRLAMIRFSQIIGALATAYTLTYNEVYVRHALRHLEAWFITPATRMNPSLQFAQAIKGRATGRGIGIIDTIHLLEVAQGLLVMEKSKAVDQAKVRQVKQWFRDYIAWLTTHPYGKEEMEAKNNHGTCWVMQVAAFARLTGQQEWLAFCRARYKDVLLPGQMSADGSFPLELKRTKPYGYSIFNLDALAMVCQILSDKKNDLWAYHTPDGKSIRKGIEFLYPFLHDKALWPFEKDVMYWEQWPVAQPALVFGGAAFHHKPWIDTWKRLDHVPTEGEVLRNLPVRNPLIWFNY